MKKTCMVLLIAVMCLTSTALIAADEKAGQLTCPRSVPVEVAIKATGPVSGWEAVPARSTFTLAITENAVRGNSMICHYSNGTVDYNLARPFPKGKTCHLAPNQSFMCQ